MAEDTEVNNQTNHESNELPSKSEEILLLEENLKEKLEKITELELKVLNLDELAKRVQADFINYKRRVDEERIKNIKYAGEGILHELLPVIDNFKRAFSHIPEELANNEWVKGVSQIEKQFLKLLSDLGVQKIECLGMPADYNFHEVIGQDVGPKDIILNEAEAGYLYHDKVLRVSKVIVGNGVQ